MGIFDGSILRWLGKPARKPASASRSAPRAAPVAAASQFQNSLTSIDASQSPHGMRKDLLRMVLRETLSRTGIPTTWVGADLLRTTGRGKEAGVHVRFLVRHWDPRLMTHAVAFEQNFIKRVMVMDPLASNWLMGLSWQFAIDDTSQCPALPHPGSWTQSPTSDAHSAKGPATRPGGVIEGPVSVQGQQDVRVGLERLMAAGDAENKQKNNRDFEKTQPIRL